MRFGVSDERREKMTVREAVKAEMLRLGVVSADAVLVGKSGTPILTDDDPRLTKHLRGRTIRLYQAAHALIPLEGSKKHVKTAGDNPAGSRRVLAVDSRAIRQSSKAVKVSR